MAHLNTDSGWGGGKGWREIMLTSIQRVPGLLY